MVFYGPASAITVLYGGRGRNGKRGYIPLEWDTLVGDVLQGEGTKGMAFPTHPLVFFYVPSYLHIFNLHICQTRDRHLESPPKDFGVYIIIPRNYNTVLSLFVKSRVWIHLRWIRTSDLQRRSPTPNYCATELRLH